MSFYYGLYKHEIFIRVNINDEGLIRNADRFELVDCTYVFFCACLD